MGIGSRIKFIRKSKGMTLGDIAKRSGLHKSNISEIENERRFKPNLSTLERLAEALECSMEEFFSLTLEYDEELGGGLRAFLEDKKLLKMMRVTADEKDWLKSVRFRSHQKPTKDTYIDLLYTFRNLDKND